ncbi:unnamed protein product [Ostreobium quekettii]|uniref:C-type lectin domain-containing protein n=1 Tax=Ostreobium quekettii TaxID=121088 RepID=A0A8S1J6T2_9CHLO|nr:unnamed protein product [Ostreobium quekettii]
MGHCTCGTGARATIFAFSLGSSADGSLPRQVACASGGAWGSIGDGDDPLTAMSTYYTYIASGRHASGDVSRSTPVWSNPYEDDGGLGTLTTVARPIYSPRGAEGVPGVLVGVVGHDVPIGDLEREGDSHAAVLDGLVARSSRCAPLVATPCQLQVHRSHSADEATCSDAPPASGCYRYRSAYYRVPSDRLNWDASAASCRSAGGALASVRNAAELRFVSGIAPPDGAWLGARRPSPNADAFSWQDEGLEALRPDSDYWGLGEPNNYGGSEACADVDRRGASRNMNDEDCSKEQRYVCEFAARPAGCANVTLVDDGAFFVHPPVSLCVDEENVVADTAPVAGAARLSSADAVCEFGEFRPTEEVACCADCLKGSATQVGAIVGGVVGGLLGAAICGGVCFGIYKCCKPSAHARPARGTPTGASSAPLVQQLPAAPPNHQPFPAAPVGPIPQPYPADQGTPAAQPFPAPGWAKGGAAQPSAPPLQPPAYAF